MEGARILAVDHDPAVRRLVEITLGADGFDVDVAANANEAWTVLRHRGRPDLVLTRLERPIDLAKLRAAVRTAIALKRRERQLARGEQR